ncbi:MAG TPA: haloalkane dehalogenase, partial [Vicinamibacteria bacterium]|nr:haloalkane dehalogenase [Vicinamibacteria bacterium]
MTGPAPPLPDWIARQLPPAVRRYRADVGGLRMHVMETGEGRPVLAVHGNPTWSFLYRKVAAALAGEPLRLVMPDLVGL